MEKPLFCNSLMTSSPTKYVCKNEEIPTSTTDIKFPITTFLFVNRSLVDTKGHKYHVTDEIESTNNYSCLRSEDGYTLKIFKESEYTHGLSEKIKWLCTLDNDVSRYIALPISALTGLKRDEMGYVYQPASENTLSIFTTCPKEDKLFKWYFEKTGGLEYRLKLLYRLADLLLQIHKIGFCLVDIAPQNFVLKAFDLTKNIPSELQFIKPEAISSYAYQAITNGQQGYIDPMVYQGKSSPSTISDTFSFAVLAFEVLSICHPFEGELKNNLSQKEFERAVSNGKLPYIGNSDSLENKNEVFEATTEFIPNELLVLFKRMFISGIHNVTERPRLSNFRNAILQSLRRSIQCNHDGCNKLYPYNQQHRCPFCGNITQKVLKINIFKSITASEKLLLPHDSIDNFSSLPTTNELINWGVLHPGLQKLTRSYFEPDIESIDDKTYILIYYVPDKKVIAIKNKFSRISITINGKTLKPCVKKSRSNYLDIWLSSDSEIEITLPVNISLSTESTVETTSTTYGTILQNWTLTISQGGESYEE